MTFPRLVCVKALPLFAAVVMPVSAVAVEVDDLVGVVCTVQDVDGSNWSTTTYRFKEVSDGKLAGSVVYDMSWRRGPHSDKIPAEFSTVASQGDGLRIVVKRPRRKDPSTFTVSTFTWAGPGQDLHGTLDYYSRGAQKQRPHICRLNEEHLPE